MIHEKAILSACCFENTERIVSLFSPFGNSPNELVGSNGLNVHRTTVYDYINLAGLPVTRLSPKAVRIDEDDLKVWIEQRKAVS